MYGVETMSEHLFRKPAAALTLPEAAFIAGLIRAPSALSPWSNYEGALERSHVVLAQMREQRLITPEQEAAAREVRPRIQPYRQPRERARGVGQGISCGSSSANEFGGDHPPDWQVHTTFIAGVQDAAETRGRGRAPAAEPTRPRGRAGRARSVDRRHPGDGRRRRLRAQHLQPRDAQPASAGFGVQAARLRRGARKRLFAGVGAVESAQRVRRRAIPSGARATPKASRPTR